MIPYPEHNASPAYYDGCRDDEAVARTAVGELPHPPRHAPAPPPLPAALDGEDADDGADRLRRATGRPELRRRGHELRRVQHRGRARHEQRVGRARARSFALLPDLRGRGTPLPRRTGRPLRDSGRRRSRCPRRGRLHAPRRGRSRQPRDARGREQRAAREDESAAVPRRTGRHGRSRRHRNAARRASRCARANTASSTRSR